MSQPDENRSEFYVGYLPQMPPGYARLIRPVVALLLASAALFAYVLPKLHNSYDLSRSDYRDIRDFEGLLLAKPAPQLVVMRPGSSGSQQLSSYLLVGRGKSGPKIDVEALDGKYVTVKGSLIYRGAGSRGTLISVRSAEEKAVEEHVPPEGDSPKETDVTPTASIATQQESLGVFTLQGEIVDAKCYFGTMRPGNTKVHRGCAARCILGGIPPLLLVRDASGGELTFLLVAADGSAVNQRIADSIAEPVEISGEVIRMNDRFILKADPASYRRL